MSAETERRDRAPTREPTDRRPDRAGVSGELRECPARCVVVVMAHGKRSLRGLRGSCISGKARFATRAAALDSLARAKRDSSPKRAEYRAYACDRCGGFHLSSHPPFGEDA